MGWKMSHRSSAQLIIVWSGAALIAAGILMIIPQLYFEIPLMQKLVHPNTSGAERAGLGNLHRTISGISA
jgi:hypothetical protein